MRSKRAQKRLIGAGALAGVAAMAAFAGALPASATDESRTTVWAGYSQWGSAQPDPGSGGPGDGTLTFSDPTEFTVAPGATVAIDFTASCMDPFADGAVPTIQFHLYSEISAPIDPVGSWEDELPGMNSFTGTVSFVMPSEETNITVNAQGTRCFEEVLDNGRTQMLDEALYRFEPAAVADTGSTDDDNIAGEDEDEVATALELALGFEAGDPVAGAEVVATAAGLKPGSDWTLQMFSEPRTIASGVVGDDGIVLQAATLPADTPAGAHRLLLTGVAADGSALTSEGWFAVDANGTITAVSTTGPVEAPAAQLASTGFDSTVGFVALLGIVAGFALLVARRRTAQ